MANSHSECISLQATMKSVRSQYISVIICLFIVHQAVSMAMPCEKNSTRAKRDMPDFSGIALEAASTAAEVIQNGAAIKDKFEANIGEQIEFL